MRNVTGVLFAAVAMLSVLLFAGGRQSAPAGVHSSAQPDARRPFDATRGGAWIGSGIAYGPHRDDQSPGISEPTESQILEDLQIISRHWGMVRVYASRGAAGTMCKLIRERGIPLKLMVGAWIAPEWKETDSVRQDLPDLVAANNTEITEAIRLANEYPEVVMAIGVGNETQVSWSVHRSSQERLIAALRQVRSATTCPVTTCDDFAYWTSPESRPVANECDFVALHLYAMWNKQALPDALDWTREKLADVERTHPGVPIVVTEIGWATAKGTEGYQAIGVVGVPGEGEQELFFRALRDWAGHRKLAYFFFEAFDEKWKGGSSPDEVEKHWGVFNSDRTPKRTMSSAPDAQAK